MNRMRRTSVLLSSTTAVFLMAGCAKNDEPNQMKRERDRLSYQVTDLKGQLDQANAEIARLKTAQK